MEIKSKNTVRNNTTSRSRYATAVDYIKRIAFTMAATVVLLPAFVSGSAYASDWTMDAYSGCQVRLGSASPFHSGFKASGGVAVISCPITKKTGSGNLNWVYARIERESASGSTFCNLNSNSLNSTSRNSTYGYASSSTSPQSISMPLPTLYSTGYLNLTCVLNSGDILYGIRYGQD